MVTTYISLLPAQYHFRSDSTACLLTFWWNSFKRMVHTVHHTCILVFVCSKFWGMTSGTIYHTNAISTISLLHYHYPKQVSKAHYIHVSDKCFSAVIRIVKVNDWAICFHQLLPVCPEIPSRYLMLPCTTWSNSVSFLNSCSAVHQFIVWLQRSASLD